MELTSLERPRKKGGNKIPETLRSKLSEGLHRASHPNMESSEESRSDSEMRHSICHPSSRAVKVRLQTKKSLFLDLFY